jgi:hypothetical protein
MDNPDHIKTYKKEIDPEVKEYSIQFPQTAKALLKSK